jgi:hypothetical protein
MPRKMSSGRSRSGTNTKARRAERSRSSTGVGKSPSRSDSVVRSRRAFERLPAGSVIVSPNAQPSEYARKAVRVFSAGVQDAYRELARKGVKTVVLQDGHLIEGVPRKVRGTYVVVGSDVG